ncbi:hypothetical protein HHI36_023480 [Cryptolaemus montrouzieri]|uniref:Uncharacterized protein n=1 Tax=Cryptolaemus montrouzieri TaxID=559131 RepID=A0ABD2PH93_9CUCU
MDVSTSIQPLNTELFADYMYEPGGTINIPLEDISKQHYHHQIAPSLVPIAGPSKHQLLNSVLLPVTNGHQASETPHLQQRPDENNTFKTTNFSEQADNSTATTGQVSHR